jgi:hypothetical protein
VAVAVAGAVAGAGGGGRWRAGAAMFPLSVRLIGFQERLGYRVTKNEEMTEIRVRKKICNILLPLLLF